MDGAGLMDTGSDLLGAMPRKLEITGISLPLKDRKTAKIKPRSSESDKDQCHQHVDFMIPFLASM